jgi:O-antigen ligase
LETLSLSRYRYFRLEYLAFLILLLLYALLLVQAPGLIVSASIALPGLIIAGLLVLVFRKTLVILSLLSSAFVIYNAPGLDVGEVLFYFLLALVFFFILIPIILNGDLRIQGGADMSMVVFTILLYVSIGTGFIYSGSMIKPINEALYFYSAVFFYFVYKYYFSDAQFRRWFFAALLFVFLFVIIRTYFAYYTAMISVVAEWEFNFVRGAGNENILLFGAICVLSFLLHLKQATYKYLLSILLVFTLGAIIATLTRGLWVVTLFSFGLIYLLVQGAERKKFITILISTLSLILLAGAIYWDFTLFVFELLSLRFSSIGTGTQDISLLERVLETKAVFDMILTNPIAGYGLGSEYLRHNLLMQNTMGYTFYIHNGYLAVWFKFGLFGLLTLLAYCGFLFHRGYRMYKHSSTFFDRVVGLVTVVYLTAATVLNITTPVFLSFEGMFVLILLGSYISSTNSTIEPVRNDNTALHESSIQ